MALILKDRVKETTAVTSTGTATLLGAVTGYQSFSAIGNGNTCYYTIAAQTTNEWEVGIGTYTSPDQLSRDTVLSSSNSGSLVNFSAGTKDVFVAQPSSKAVYTDASNIINTSGNAATTVTFTQVNTTNLVANTVTLTAGTITTNAANATDITNKTYVDNLFSTGITYHEPVLVESPIALNALYNQPGGAGNGVGATLTNNGSNAALVVDGITLSNTARVLVYQQSNAVHNGVYTVTNSGAPDAPGPGAKWVLTRATDADTYGVGDPNKLGQGDAFFVQSGNTGAGETYILNTVGTITFGTTNLTFAQISSAQVYSAGTGLSLTNLAFSISNTAVTAAQYGNDGAVGQFTVNAQGQITNAANVSINASSISVGTLANGRTTAASANGASTIVARDANGSFAANVITATTVNATSGNFTNISGNAASLTDINASNITSGTISNARTTASDANGASTIVTRDANGAFSAGNVTAANFIGAGTTITSINASNISSGTIANARTTAASANGASTIVSRDSGGNFSANTVTAAVIGDISGGSNINASNISSGTIANARTTASASNGASTIVLRDAGGAFAAGAITGTSFTGNGSALTAINASSISSGTLDNARTNATSANGASTLVVRDSNGSFAGNVITATTFSGNGASLTGVVPLSGGVNMTGSLYTRGSFGMRGNVAGNPLMYDVQDQAGATVLEIGRADNVAATTAMDFHTGATSIDFDTRLEFTGGNGFSGNGAMTIRAASVALASPGVYSGNGSGISAINASNISSGTIANARTTAATANGASTIVLRGTSGEFSAGAITSVSISGNGVALTAINASNVTFGTLDNARTTAASANGASTIVARDANGSFTANAGTFTTVSGAGSGLTSINASNISSGTVATARLASGTANSSTYLRGDQTWATVSAGVTITNDTSTNASYYPIFTTASTGSISAANVSTTELTFNPGTNILSAPVVSSSYGFSMNPATLSTSFTIPASFNAVSAGPVTLANGVTITVSTGSAWVVV